MFDTWFFNPAQLAELKGMDVDTIAMIKKNSTKYLWTDPETRNQSRLGVKEIALADRNLFQTHKELSETADRMPQHEL